MPRLFPAVCNSEPGRCSYQGRASTTYSCVDPSFKNTRQSHKKNTISPIEPLYNHSFHFIFHFLFHVILHYSLLNVAFFCVLRLMGLYLYNVSFINAVIALLFNLRIGPACRSDCDKGSCSLNPNDKGNCSLSSRHEHPWEGPCSQLSAKHCRAVRISVHGAWWLIVVFFQVSGSVPLWQLGCSRVKCARLTRGMSCSEKRKLRTSVNRLLYHIHKGFLRGSSHECCTSTHDQCHYASCG